MTIEFDLATSFAMLNEIIGKLNGAGSNGTGRQLSAVVRIYDEPSDTFLIHFYGRGRRTYSAPVHVGDRDPFMLLVDRDSGEVVSVHFENFVHGFVPQMPSAARMLAGAEWRPATSRKSGVLGNRPEQESLDRFGGEFAGVAG